jgi:hypothetical protein
MKKKARTQTGKNKGKRTSSRLQKAVIQTKKAKIKICPYCERQYKYKIQFAEACPKCLMRLRI